MSWRSFVRSWGNFGELGSWGAGELGIWSEREKERESIRYTQFLSMHAHPCILLRTPEYQRMHLGTLHHETTHRDARAAIHTQAHPLPSVRCMNARSQILLCFPSAPFRITRIRSFGTQPPILGARRRSGHQIQDFLETSP